MCVKTLLKTNASFSHAFVFSHNTFFNTDLLYLYIGEVRSKDK